MRTILALLSFCLVAQADAIEATASFDFNTQDTGLVNLNTTMSELVTATLAKQQACTTKGMIYKPTAAGADSGGCIDTAIGRCGKIGKIYAPNDATRDSNGCVIFPTFNLPICPNLNSIIADATGNWVCGAIN